MDERPSFQQSSLFKSPFVVSLLAIATVSLLIYNITLQKQNHSLLKTAQKIQQTLETLETENKHLIERTEKERNEFAALKEENQTLQADLKKVADDLGAAEDEKTYLEEMLIHKTREIESLRKNSAANANAETVSRQIRDKEEEIRRLSDHNKLLVDKLRRLYKTTNDKIAEINVAKMSLEETISGARDLIDSEWKTVELGSISVNAPAKQAEPKKPAKKEGRVLAINEDHGFVVVDVGKADGVRSDSTLFLKQNGQSIGTLTVLEVRDVMTACNIKEITQGKKIQVNDPVLVQR
ncbi:MAG: hypothetical protein ACREH5_03415 [Candidatus Omnitrophota bacterium]